jgi:hypothetical protein
MHGVTPYKPEREPMSRISFSTSDINRHVAPCKRNHYLSPCVLSKVESQVN